MKESRAHLLLPFVVEVDSYTSLDIPDYEKLKHLLEKILLDKYESPKAHCNMFDQEMKSINRNVNLMSTLEVNFEWENMSEASMDSEDFGDICEFSDAELLHPVNT